MDPLKLDTAGANSLIAACSTNNVDLINFILDKVGGDKKATINRIYGTASTPLATALLCSAYATLTLLISSSITYLYLQKGSS